MVFSNIALLSMETSRLGNDDMQKQIKQIIRNVPQHWVGDGFPVRSLFNYGGGNVFDPFLLLDYAGPHHFAAAAQKRGVDVHPHKGFETVTILYQGELAHRDSSGGSGNLAPGDVQWMTAGKGIVHEEFHSESFTQQGGTLEMVQLWVNLPAKDKATPPKYQDLRDEQFPRVYLDGKGGLVRVIAGEFNGTRGPASTFTPINVWDIQHNQDSAVQLRVPVEHTCLLVVQQGSFSVNNNEVRSGELIQFEQAGTTINLQTRSQSRVLLLSGKPINEPVVGQGPFVMNTREGIRQAILEYQAGKMGQLS